MIVMSNLHSVL